MSKNFKIPLETKNKISEDLKNNVSLKDIMKTYNVSRATIFRIKKDNIIEKITETTNNETDNDNETETKDTTINDNETNEEEDIVEETVIDFDIEKFKKELNESIKSLDNESEKESNNVSLVSNNNSIVSKKSVQFKNKPFIIKPEIINDKNNVIDVIKNCNIAKDIDELKEIRSNIIIIKQYINTFEKDLKPIFGNNRYIFEKKLFTLNLNQLKVILEDIRITINLKSNKSSFLTISQALLKGIETVSIYSGYDVSGLEQELMTDPDFIMDLQILSCELDISKYLNPKSSCFLKIIKKAYMLNTQNKMKNSLSKINDNKDLLNKIKELNVKK